MRKVVLCVLFISPSFDFVLPDLFLQLLLGLWLGAALCVLLISLLAGVLLSCC
jgi:hypothetical protein